MSEPVDLAAYGWSDAWAQQLDALGRDDVVPGRVLRHDGVAVVAATAGGIEQVPLAQGGEHVVVGDWVAVADDGRVVAVLPRASLLRRRDAIAEDEQPLVANLDELLIVCGLDRPVKAGRILRSATLAADAGAEAIVVLTKADLAADLAPSTAMVHAVVPELEVRAVCALTGDGVEELRGHLRGRTVALLGESGAGKSTLINALVGDDVAETGRVRHGDAKGRHTTTARELYLLPGGGVLVDTPGIRSIGVWVDTDAVDDAFADVVELAAGCRFSDCGHGTEPGCAVRAAVDDGTLAARRLAAWHELQAEAEAAEVRADEQRRRAKGKAQSKAIRQMYRDHKPRRR